uniref:Uncharacterized protein n=1 Tax=Arundo donax TaxID=35708 RepID=A0A0A9BNU5_ARUDO
MDIAYNDSDISNASSVAYLLILHWKFGTRHRHIAGDQDSGKHDFINRLTTLAS